MRKGFNNLKPNLRDINSKFGNIIKNIIKQQYYFFFIIRIIEIKTAIKITIIRKNILFYII